MFKSVKFRNFKSLKDYYGPLESYECLGRTEQCWKINNPRCISSDGRGTPARIATCSIPNRLNGTTVVGYEIPMSNFPISLANVHSDYQTNHETSVTFSLENGNKLQLNFYDNTRCIMTIIEAKQRTTTTAQFRKNFPVSIFPFPTFGPRRRGASSYGRICSTIGGHAAFPQVVPQHLVSATETVRGLRGARGKDLGRNDHIEA